MRIGKSSAFLNFFFTISRTMLNFIHYKNFFRISYSLQVATTQKLQPFQVNRWVAFCGLASVRAKCGLNVLGITYVLWNEDKKKLCSLYLIGTRNRLIFGTYLKFCMCSTKKVPNKYILGILGQPVAIWLAQAA